MDSFVSYPPRPSTLGGCCYPERPVTVRAFILKGLPPPLPWPLPGLLGVDFCLTLPPPPRSLPLFGLLPLEHLCSVAFPGRVSDQLNCSSSQSFYIAKPSDLDGHTCHMWFRELGSHCGCEHPHLPQVFLGGPFWKDFDKALVCIRGLE